MSIAIDNTMLGTEAVVVKYKDGGGFVYYNCSIDGWVDWNSNQLRLVNGNGVEEQLEVHDLIDKDQIAYIASYSDDYSVFVSTNKEVVSSL